MSGTVICHYQKEKQRSITLILLLKTKNNQNHTVFLTPPPTDSVHPLYKSFLKLKVSTKMGYYFELSTSHVQGQVTQPRWPTKRSRTKRSSSSPGSDFWKTKFTESNNFTSFKTKSPWIIRWHENLPRNRQDEVCSRECTCGVHPAESAGLAHPQIHDSMHTLVSC